MAPKKQPAAPRKQPAKAKQPKPKNPGDLPAAGITRLARQAGVKSMSAIAVEDTKGVMSLFLEDVAKNASILAEYAKRKTINPEDVKAALQRMGHKVYSTGQEAAMKRCAQLRGKGAIAQIRSAQKQSECTQIARASFDRVARVAASRAARGDLRWTADAMGLLQASAEQYAIKLLADANLAAIHAKRTTVQPKDLQLVRRVRGERG